MILFIPFISNLVLLLVDFFGMTEFSKLFIYLFFGIVWFSLGFINKQTLKFVMNKIGFIISQKFKIIPYWDKYVEPFFIRQAVIIVCALSAFIEGMVSDNENKEAIKHELQLLKKEIIDDVSKLSLPETTISDIEDLLVGE